MKRITAIVLCLALMITSLSQTVLIAFAAGTPTITCESKECNPGDSITIDAVISNNPGVTYLEVTPSYSEELGTPTVNNGELFSITKGKNLVFDADEDVSDNGKLVSLTFLVSETVEPGNYSVSLTFRSACNYDENPVTFSVESATVTVKAKQVSVTGISLDKTTATVKISETVTLTPVFTPDTATNKNVTWSSSNEDIATVENGVVTGVKEGTATITVKTEDGNFEAYCAVTVEAGQPRDVCSVSASGSDNTRQYATLTEALAAAQAGDTVTLQGDITGEPFAVVKDGVTLDLNGYDLSDLTMLYVTGKIVDTAAAGNKGELNASAYMIVPGNGSYLPIYNGKKYELHAVEAKERHDANGTRFGFAADAAVAQIMGSGRVKAVVTVEWSVTDVAGKKEYKQDITFDESVMEAYLKKPATSAIKISFSGMEDFAGTRVVATPKFVTYADDLCTVIVGETRATSWIISE